MSPKYQKGFLLAEVLLVLIILGAVAYSQIQTMRTASNEALAEATGSYMLSVRGAVLKALGTYDAALTLVDTSSAPAGVYPIPPAWASFAGNEHTLYVPDLKDSGLLPNDFPERSPLGRSVYIKLLRTPDVCPGTGCEVRAFVVTCWPITEPLRRTSFDPMSCTPPPADLLASELLIHKVMSTTQGFGGENTLDPTKVRGALMNVPETLLGIPAGSMGHVAVAASLNATSFDQFVRQGDTRQIYLRNTLEVAGSITSDTGLVLNTQVERGQACEPEGMYATTLRGNLAQCRGGQWFELIDYVVTSIQSLGNGAAVPTPVCPGGNMQPFTQASLQRMDVTMTGSDIRIRGNVNGTISGSGSVSQSGNVSVTGNYTGTVASTPDSTIRVTQGVEVIAGSVVITPASSTARALVVSGCRNNG